MPWRGSLTRAPLGRWRVLPFPVFGGLARARLGEHLVEECPRGGQLFRARSGVFPAVDPVQREPCPRLALSGPAIEESPYQNTHMQAFGEGRCTGEKFLGEEMAAPPWRL